MVRVRVIGESLSSVAAAQDVDQASLAAAEADIITNATDIGTAQTDITDLEAVDNAIGSTPGAEVAGPPDHIPVPIQALEEPGGADLAAAVQFRIMLYDDVDFTTPSTVANHRLTQTAAGAGTIISGNDSIDMVVETDGTGLFDMDIEDVAGGSGVAQFYRITDAGNDDMMFSANEGTVTFD